MGRLAQFFARKVKVTESVWPPFGLRHWRWIRLAILMGADALVVIFAYYFAFVLRLDSWTIYRYGAVFEQTLPLFLATNLLAYYIMGMYRQVWRHASFSASLMVARSTLLGVVLFQATQVIIWPDIQIPRSIPPIFWLIATMILAAYKFSWRAFVTLQKNLDSSEKSRCLIYGAGNSGQLLAKHITESGASPYHFIGFIDDDKNLKNRVIGGRRVLGNRTNLEKVINKYSIEYLLIAIHSAPGSVVRSILADLPSNIKTLIMPSMNDSLSTTMIEPRPVDISDLLRRSPQIGSIEALKPVFRNKVVLITGAGGSIGSELTRQVLGIGPEAIIMFEQSEFNLYKIDTELAEISCLTRRIPILGSITSKRSLERVFSKYNPDIILHAAAYKHVPLVENNPEEGILNNVRGTKQLAEFAVAYEVEKFILVSSDKAVNPTNSMGASKRACELIVQSYHEIHKDKTCFSMVRFGNVLGSSGSVIPRFLSQMKSGGPITVTHPEVTRYFMLIEEAVSLILQTTSLSKGGETFILDMGEPVKILDMAQQLIRLSGKEVGRDIEIKITGLRNGEKLHEELLLEGTETNTILENLFIAKAVRLDPDLVLSNIDNLIETASNSNPHCVRILRDIAASRFDHADSSYIPDTRAPQVH